MYRVFILLIMAIGSMAFAVDSSAAILQAKNITDIALTVSWTPIQDAAKYRIFYDESVLLDASSPNPLLDTEFIEWTSGEVIELTPSTDYTLVVQGYTADGMSLGKTIPLHARTYSPKPLMNINWAPIAIDSKVIEVAFTRGINVVDSQMTVKNSVTGKMIKIDKLRSAEDDLRIVVISLIDPLEEWVPYEVGFQEIIALDSTPLSAENKVPLRVVWSNTGIVPASGVAEPLANPFEPIEVDDNPVITEPVPIDRLPQTGPNSIFIIIAILLSGVIVYAQKSSPGGELKKIE